MEALNNLALNLFVFILKVIYFINYDLILLFFMTRWYSLFFRWQEWWGTLSPLLLMRCIHVVHSCQICVRHFLCIFDCVDFFSINVFKEVFCLFYVSIRSCLRLYHFVVRVKGFLIFLILKYQLFHLSNVILKTLYFHMLRATVKQMWIILMVMERC